MIAVDPASTNPTNPAPAQVTVAMDSPAIRKLFGKTLLLQGTPGQYVENPVSTQDPKPPEDLHFKSADKLIVALFNDNGFPGNNPDPTGADWVLLIVTDASSGTPLLTITGPLTGGDVMDYRPATTPPVPPTPSVSKTLRVSWPYTLTPFALEGAHTADGTWQPVDIWVIDHGGEHQLFLQTSNPMQFFRLVEVK